MTEKTLVLDPRIYKKAAISQAMKDYRQIAKITVEKDPHSIIVKIKDFPQEHTNTITYEFCNYVLWKMGN